MPPAPSAAKIAAEHGVDLGAVAGSGKRGQVLKGDVLAALANPRRRPLRRPRRQRRRRRPPAARARLRVPTTPRARSGCA